MTPHARAFAVDMALLAIILFCVIGIIREVRARRRHHWERAFNIHASSIQGTDPEYEPLPEVEFQAMAKFDQLEELWNRPPYRRDAHA